MSGFLLTDALLIIGAYLLGSLSTAIIVCRLMQLPDPRTQGSHNPGATNVLRYGGKSAAAITLLGDCLKGVLPLLAGHALGAAPLVLALTGLAAFLGHLYPIFFQFRGGKGVATALGALLGLAWPVALAVLGVWLAMTALFRTSSLSALTAAVLCPVFMAWLQPQREYLAVSIVISALLIWRHRSNIRNLLGGSEDKIR